MLLLGVAIGLAIGIIPGIGSTVGFALLLPFIFGMDPYAGMALLLGMSSITATSDSITSILFGVPGTIGAAATILDGYPMAGKGEAARALGAAFFASMLGGLFGAVALTLSLPIARPLMSLLGAPEFFMLSLMGICMVGVLSARRPIRGIIAAGLGIMLASIGPSTAVQCERYTFGQTYLMDNIPLVVVALGLFGIPETVDMIIKGTSIAAVPKLGKGIFQGIKDVLHNWSILLRCSLLGTYIGFLPGLGGSVASWFAYGHVVQTSKDKENFGKGDVRGVIAPECANNAERGGSLIPTLLFGIPGSTAMAFLLVAFLILGIRPGPDMLAKNLPITFTIIWSLALANVIAAIMCCFLVRPMALLTTVRIQYIAPFILMILILGAFQSTRQWGDMIGLLALGLLGWFMKRLEWPRPPLLVGFVLAGIAEKYLWISAQLYGLGWLLHPWVIVIAILTVVSIFFTYRWQKEQGIKKVAISHSGKQA